MALQFRGAYVRDGVKRFATTSPGEHREKERERGGREREKVCEWLHGKGFIKNRCHHPGPHCRFVS